MGYWPPVSRERSPQGLVGERRCRVTRSLILAFLLMLSCAAAAHAQLAAAVLPSHLTAQVGHPALASATILNGGSTTATGCSITPVTNVPATFDYVTTALPSNGVNGTSNEPVDIPAGGAQTFRLTFSP